MRQGRLPQETHSAVEIIKAWKSKARQMHTARQRDLGLQFKPGNPDSSREVPRRQISCKECFLTAGLRKPPRVGKRDPASHFPGDSGFNVLGVQLGRVLTGAFGWDRLASWVAASLFMGWTPTGIHSVSCGLSVMGSSCKTKLM